MCVCSLSLIYITGPVLVLKTNHYKLCITDIQASFLFLYLFLAAHSASFGLSLDCLLCFSFCNPSLSRFLGPILLLALFYANAYIRMSNDRGGEETK